MLNISILFRIVVCMAYYGLALNSGDLGGDLFMNFFLQSFMDIPANVIVILLLDRIGRKPLQVGSMIIGGAALMSTIFTIIYGGKGKISKIFYIANNVYPSFPRQEGVVQKTLISMYVARYEALVRILVILYFFQGQGHWKDHVSYTIIWAFEHHYQD